MIELIKTDAQNPSFKQLVQSLNSELASRDGVSHPLAQFNPVVNLKYIILALKDGSAVGCGAISSYDADSMEIKRMFVASEFRGQRIGEKILLELEKWSNELGYSRCILFTGSKQPEANTLYHRNGYNRIPRYGPLKDIPDSLCFGKEL